MKTSVSCGNLTIKVDYFSLEQTLGCGQCFRFDPVDGDPERWRGIANGRVLEIAQKGNELTFFNVSEAEYEAVWADYFDLNTDYKTIYSALCADPTLKAACDSCGANCCGDTHCGGNQCGDTHCGGIRILRQDPWEALCSFIISQNNNIPRIKGIVARLCEHFGDPIDGGFNFPKPETLAALSCEDLAPVRCGFRDKYILDAAEKFASGEIDPEKITSLPLEEARKALMTVSGVGPKVADCALLFGFYNLTSFPTDVWIKRAMAELFADGLPECARPYAGVAQQVIFHYYRAAMSLSGNRQGFPRDNTRSRTYVHFAP